MTVEEVDIIVNASVEQALKEFNKLVPTVQNAVKQITEKINNTDFNSFKTKVQQATNFVKTKVTNLIKSNKNNELAVKVNNKEAEKQISQLEKEIDSLQKKITGRQLKLDITNETLDKMRAETNQAVINEIPDAGNKRITQETYRRLDNNANYNSLISQSDKLNNEIEKYNALLDSAKAKISELEQRTSQTATTQNKLGSFFNRFTNQLKQATTNSKGLKNSFNQVPQVTQKITNNIKGMGNNLKQGLGHILKYAGALLSIRGIYSILSSCANSWLSSQNSAAKQLNANIDYMKYAMGNALAPVIQFVTNLVYQLMKAIQSVVYALTGVNIFARASAQSYVSMAGSAKKAKEETKQLAGVHSEINNVQTNKNSDSGSGGASPNFDLSKMDDMPNSIIEAIKNKDWYEVGAIVGQKLNDALDSIPWDEVRSGAKKVGTNIGKLINGFTESTNWYKVGKTISQGINTAVDFATAFVEETHWGSLGNAIGKTIGSAIANIDWNNVGKLIVKGIGSIKDLFVGIGTGIVDGIFEGIAEKAGKGFIWKIIKTLVVDPVVKHTKELFGIHSPSTVMKNEVGINIVEGIFQGILQAISGVGNWIYTNIFKPFIDGFKNVFGIHSPSTVMTEMGGYIVEGLFNGLSNIWNKVSSIFTNLASKIGDKFAEIKNNVNNWSSSTKETIRNWADSAKNKISDCWSNASNTIKSKTDSIKSNISTGLNSAKSTINTWASNVKTTWSNHWNNMSSKVKSGLDTVKSHITNWGNTTKLTFSNINKNATTWGKDLVTNIANGIKNNIGKATNAVSLLANKIKSFLHFSEPDVGPLSNFHTYMPDMIDLMVTGIHSNIGKLTKELENLTGQMSYTINTPDINPLLMNSVGVSKSIMQPRNIMADTLSDILSSNENTTNITIPLTVQVGNERIGKILLDDLRNMKRRTGKDIEALVGG